MPSTAAFTIEGDERFTRALRLLYDAQRDWTRVWPQVAAKFWEIERRYLDRQAFAPLSPAYRAAKERQFPGQPILRRTGELFRALTRGPSEPHAIYRQTPETLTLGADIGGYHQTGTSRMPARPPIDLSESDYLELREVARLEFANTALQLGFEVSA